MIFCFLFSEWRLPRSGKKRSELLKFYHILEEASCFYWVGGKITGENGAVTKNITTAWLSKNRMGPKQIPSFPYLFFFFFPQLWEELRQGGDIMQKGKFCFYSSRNSFNTRQKEGVLASISLKFQILFFVLHWHSFHYTSLQEFFKKHFVVYWGIAN